MRMREPRATREATPSCRYSSTIATCNNTYCLGVAASRSRAQGTHVRTGCPVMISHACSRPAEGTFGTAHAVQMSGFGLHIQDGLTHAHQIMAHNGAQKTSLRYILGIASANPHGA